MDAASASNSGLPSDLLQLCYVKQLSPSDAASSKQIKLPKSEGKAFIGELRHKQRCLVAVIDQANICWEFLCTCYGCQYALSRVAAFANTHALKPGQYLIFYQDILNRLRVHISHTLPPELLQQKTENAQLPDNGPTQQQPLDHSRLLDAADIHPDDAAAAAAAAAAVGQWAPAAAAAAVTATAGTTNALQAPGRPLRMPAAFGDLGGEARHREAARSMPGLARQRQQQLMVAGNGSAAVSLRQGTPAVASAATAATAAAAAAGRWPLQLRGSNAQQGLPANTASQDAEDADAVSHISHSSSSSDGFNHQRHQGHQMQLLQQQSLHMIQLPPPHSLVTQSDHQDSSNAAMAASAMAAAAAAANAAATAAAAAAAAAAGTGGGRCEQLQVPGSGFEPYEAVFAQQGPFGRAPAWQPGLGRRMGFSMHQGSGNDQQPKRQQLIHRQHHLQTDSDHARSLQAGTEAAAEAAATAAFAAGASAAAGEGAEGHNNGGSHSINIAAEAVLAAQLWPLAWVSCGSTSMSQQQQQHAASERSSGSAAARAGDAVFVSSSSAGYSSEDLGQDHSGQMQLLRDEGRRRQQQQDWPPLRHSRSWLGAQGSTISSSTPDKRPTKGQSLLLRSQAAAAAAAAAAVAAPEVCTPSRRGRAAAAAAATHDDDHDDGEGAPAPFGGTGGIAAVAVGNAAAADAAAEAGALDVYVSPACSAAPVRTAADRDILPLQPLLPLPPPRELAATGAAASQKPPGEQHARAASTAAARAAAGAAGGARAGTHSLHASSDAQHHHHHHHQGDGTASQAWQGQLPGMFTWGHLPSVLPGSMPLHQPSRLAGGNPLLLGCAAAVSETGEGKLAFSNHPGSSSTGCVGARPNGAVRSTQLLLQGPEAVYGNAARLADDRYSWDCGVAGAAGQHGGAATGVSGSSSRGMAWCFDDIILARFEQEQARRRWRQQQQQLCDTEAPRHRMPLGASTAAAAAAAAAVETMVAPSLPAQLQSGPKAQQGINSGVDDRSGGAAAVQVRWQAAAESAARFPGLHAAAVGMLPLFKPPASYGLYGHGVQDSQQVAVEARQVAGSSAGMGAAAATAADTAEAAVSSVVPAAMPGDSPGRQEHVAVAAAAPADDDVGEASNPAAAAPAAHGHDEHCRVPASSATMQAISAQAGKVAAAVQEATDGVPPAESGYDLPTAMLTGVKGAAGSRDNDTQQQQQQGRLGKRPATAPPDITIASKRRTAATYTAGASPDSTSGGPSAEASPPLVIHSPAHSGPAALCDVTLRTNNAAAAAAAHAAASIPLAASAAAGKRSWLQWPAGGGGGGGDGDGEQQVAKLQNLRTGQQDLMALLPELPVLRHPEHWWQQHSSAADGRSSGSANEVVQQQQQQVALQPQHKQEPVATQAGRKTEGLVSKAAATPAAAHAPPAAEPVRNPLSEPHVSCAGTRATRGAAAGAAGAGTSLGMMPQTSCQIPGLPASASGAAIADCMTAYGEQQQQHHHHQQDDLAAAENLLLLLHSGGY